MTTWLQQHLVEEEEEEEKEKEVQVVQVQVQVHGVKKEEQMEEMEKQFADEHLSEPPYTCKLSPSAQSLELLGLQ